MKSSCSSVSFRHSTVSMLFVFVLVALISFTGITTAVYADTFSVISVSDDISNPVEGSLRYAIENATAGDVITFNLKYPATITLNERIVIDKNLTIQGPGEDRLTISGGGACQIFKVNSDSSEPIITISDLTIADGYADYGGGIVRYHADLTVENVTFLNNTATAVGGGICYPDRVTNSTFIGNTAGREGGGMYNGNNSVVVNGCTFTDNTAFRGGGMYSEEYFPGMSVAVANCTFTGNTATEIGGGIYNHHAILSIANCTFTDNIADVYGGGMYNICLNSFSITNCIFWGNTGGEIYDYVPADSYTYCVISHDSPGDYGANNINTDPLLQELADNGGPTWTCALGEGSSAIDAGTELDDVATDQRGVFRPKGGGYDIGAYEVVNKYTINAYSNTGGIVSPESADVWEGDSMDFTFLPDPGYEVWEVYVDGDPVSYDEVNLIYTFYNVSSDHEISADFQPVDNGGGGCNVSALPGMGLLLVLPLMFLSGKMK